MMRTDVPGLSRKRFLTGIASASAAAFVLSGCAEPKTGIAARGGDLVLARAQDASTLLPPTTTQNADIWTLQQVYETLTLNKPDGSSVEPGLATKWSESDDKRSWTFHLRQGVKFHSGKTLDADDVVFSLNYARDQKDETNLWAAEFALISAVKKIDEETVKIELSQPWDALPSYLALFAASIYPAEFGGHDTDYMAKNADGTGPFKVDSWSKGQSLKLSKNADYWQKGVPFVDSVSFNVVADDNTRRLQLQGGQAHIDEEPSALSMSTINRSQDTSGEAFESTKILYFNLNNTLPELSDAKLRRALSYAIDRSSVLKVVYAGYGQVANSFISPGLQGHDSDVNGGEFSMEKAKALLSEITIPDNLELTIQVTSGYSDRELLSQIAQQAWQDLGLKVTIAKLDNTTMVANRSNGDFQIQVGYATSDVVDTSQMINFLAVTDGSGIRSGYNNPDVNRWAAEAITTSDPDEKNKLYSKIQQKVADDAPIIPVAFQKSLYGISAKVHGFRPYVLGTYGLKQTKMES